MSTILDEPIVITDTTTQVWEPGDEDRFAHYVRKSDIVAATIEGVPVIALCGKRWVPNRAPDKFPVCPECKEVWLGFDPE